jgi:hypothetical protein
LYKKSWNFCENALLEKNSNSIYWKFVMLIFLNSHVQWRFNYKTDIKLLNSLSKIRFKNQFLHQIDFSVFRPDNMNNFDKFLKIFWQCWGCALQFSAEIRCQSENIQALGDHSNLIGEKSPIRRQRVNVPPDPCEPTVPCLIHLYSELIPFLVYCKLLVLSEGLLKVL